jgi:hypothetical protein
MDSTTESRISTNLKSGQESSVWAQVSDSIGKRLGCGLGRHKANYRFFELPIRLVRNNPHTRNWKVLTFTTVLAGLAFSGILLRDHLIQRKTERQTQAAREKTDYQAGAIHECAIAKVATTCTPDGRFESCDRGGRYPKLKSPEEAIKAAEGDCTAETDPHSAQRQIEDYRHQHRIDLEPGFEVVDAPPSRQKTRK